MPAIYCWTLGELALAQVALNVYARVRIVKDENGLFYDDKVLGIDVDNADNLKVREELCYYVENCRSGECCWLPYTCLQLAERSRPYYGPTSKDPTPVKPVTIVRKRKLREDHTLPLSTAKQVKVKTDLNATYDLRHLPMKIGKYENAYKEFIRRGKDMIFDEFFFLLQNDETRAEDLHYLLHIDASTEDKLATVLQGRLAPQDARHWLQQTWRYSTINRDEGKETRRTEVAPSGAPQSSPTVHAPWCLVCGAPDELAACALCPAAYHAGCARHWLTAVMHRKNLPQVDEAPPSPVATVEKVSRTRALTRVQAPLTRVQAPPARVQAPPARVQAPPAPALCPSCTWGPRVGYGDVVWHKLGACSWWPARVLTPGSVPSCLLSRKHDVRELAVEYYGEGTYSWASPQRLLLFLPSHAAAVGRAAVRRAVLDAADDYIAVYLT